MRTRLRPPASRPQEGPRPALSAPWERPGLGPGPSGHVCCWGLWLGGPRLLRCNGEYWGLGHTEQGLSFLFFFFFL